MTSPFVASTSRLNLLNKALVICVVGLSRLAVLTAPVLNLEKLVISPSAPNPPRMSLLTIVRCTHSCISVYRCNIDDPLCLLLKLTFFAS